MKQASPAIGCNLRPGFLTAVSWVRQNAIEITQCTLTSCLQGSIPWILPLVLFRFDWGYVITLFKQYKLHAVQWLWNMIVISGYVKVKKAVSQAFFQKDWGTQKMLLKVTGSQIKVQIKLVPIKYQAQSISTVWFIGYHYVTSYHLMLCSF
jgi:hypothetical protein